MKEKKTLNPYKTSLSTGTTVVAVPYNEGYILAADHRATEMRTLKEYFCEKVFSTSLEEIYFGMAGAGNSNQIVIKPFIAHMKQKMLELSIDINEIANPSDFLSFWNSIVGDYIRNKSYNDPWWMYIASESVWIIVIRTKKLNFSFEARLCADDCVPAQNALGEAYDDYEEKRILAKGASEIISIGSGSRYVLGNLVGNLENWQKKGLEKSTYKHYTKEEVLDYLKVAFKTATSHDMGSSVINGYQAYIIPKKGHGKAQKVRVKVY